MPKVPGDVARNDMAVDEKGRPLPYSPQEVRSILLRMVDEGELLAVIVRGPNGDLGVQVFGPPSQELLGVLEQATDGYRAALKGH